MMPKGVPILPGGMLAAGRGRAGLTPTRGPGVHTPQPPPAHSQSMMQLPTGGAPHLRPAPPRAGSPPMVSQPPPGTGLAGRPTPAMRAPPPPVATAPQPSSAPSTHAPQLRIPPKTAPAPPLAPAPAPAPTEDVESKIRELTSRLATLQQANDPSSAPSDDPYAYEPPPPAAEEADEYGDSVPAAPPPAVVAPRVVAPSQMQQQAAPSPPQQPQAAASPVIALPIVLPDTSFVGDDPAAYWDPSQLDDVSAYETSAAMLPPPAIPAADVDPYATAADTADVLPPPPTSVPPLRVGAHTDEDHSPLSSRNPSLSASSSALPSFRDIAGSGGALPSPLTQSTSVMEQPLPDVPDTIVDIDECPPEGLVALLTGDDTADDEYARRARSKAPDMRRLRVVVCGGAASGGGKALWLVRALGYACARRPDSDLLHRRVKHDGKIYLLEFSVTDETFAFAEAAYRWGDAFVLIGDVESRDSFEAVKAFHSAATREREAPALPMILVMNRTAAQAEETWKVTRAEAAALSETLNVPLCDVATASAAEASIHTLINEVLKFDLGIRTEKKPSQQQQQQMLQQQPSGGPVMAELEFVVLGDAFVGKTSFVSRTFGDAFSSAYTATTAKAIRKQVMRLSNEGYIIKLVDSPGFFPEQAMRMHDWTAGASALENAAEMAVQWLQQQSLLQAHGFVVLFSVASRESFAFAQELVSRIQVALVDAPGSRNQVKLLLGTKADLVHMRAVGDAEIAEAAQRLGTLHSAVSLRTGEKEVLRLLFERLANALYGREPAGGAGTTGHGTPSGPGTPVMHAASPSMSMSSGSLTPGGASPSVPGRHLPERSGSTLTAKEQRKQQEKLEKAARKERERLEKLEKEARKKAGKK